MTGEIRLSGGLVALVDDVDFERALAAGNWHARPHGYTTYAQRHTVRSDGRRTTQQLHQFLLGCRGVDHVNGNGLDNRRRNLRPADQSRNMANARLLRSNNTSGFRGVTKPASKRRWVAQIGIRGRVVHLGSFDSPETAARAYDVAAIEAFGEFARLNFPITPEISA